MNVVNKLNNVAFDHVTTSKIKLRCMNENIYKVKVMKGNVKRH